MQKAPSVKTLLSGDRESPVGNGLERQALGAFTLVAAVAKSFMQQEQGLPCYSDHGSMTTLSTAKVNSNNSKVSARKNDQLTASKDDTLSAVQTLRTEQKSLAPSSIAAKDEQETAVTQMVSPQTITPSAQAVTKVKGVQKNISGKDEGGLDSPQLPQSIKAGLTILPTETVKGSLKVVDERFGTGVAYSDLWNRAASRLRLKWANGDVVRLTLKQLADPKNFNEQEVFQRAFQLSTDEPEIPIPLEERVAAITQIYRYMVDEEEFQQFWLSDEERRLLPGRSEAEEAFDLIKRRSKVYERSLRYDIDLNFKPLFEAVEQNRKVSTEAKKLVNMLPKELSPQEKAKLSERLTVFERGYAECFHEMERYFAVNQDSYPPHMRNVRLEDAADAESWNALRQEYLVEAKAKFRDLTNEIKKEFPEEAKCLNLSTIMFQLTERGRGPPPFQMDLQKNGMSFLEGVDELRKALLILAKTG